MLGMRKAEVEALRREYQNAARLVDISRNGRLIVFTFIRDGKAFTIETMGMMADDVESWKTQAGLK